MKIERIKINEIAETKQLLSHTWTDTYGGFLSERTIKKVTSVWHDPKLLAAQAQDPNIFFGVAKDDNEKIVGLITVKKIDNETLIMYRLYVHPIHQRQGIGKRLFDDAIKAFPEAKKIILQVEEKNRKGHSFYLKQGFRDMETKKEKIEEESMKVIVMKKDIVL